MDIFSKLFSRNKPIQKHVEGVGIFEFFNDGVDSYWLTECPVLNLPAEFDFGAIRGDISSINPVALAKFRSIAEAPDLLFAKINDEFFTKTKQYFNMMSPADVRAEFYVKSLSVSHIAEYEFGFHSRSKDIFVELFVRDDVVKEMYIDEGCCEM